MTERVTLSGCNCTAPQESTTLSRAQFLALDEWLSRQTVQYDLTDVRTAMSRLSSLAERLRLETR